MIANISPASSCCEYTLNTLRYADRVKELKKESGGGKTSKEDMKSKELMLARQSYNTRKIEVDQRTGKPLEAHMKSSDPPKPTLKKGASGLTTFGSSMAVDSGKPALPKSVSENPVLSNKPS